MSRGFGRKIGYTYTPPSLALNRMEVSTPRSATKGDDKQQTGDMKRNMARKRLERSSTDRSPNTSKQKVEPKLNKSSNSTTFIDETSTETTGNSVTNDSHNQDINGQSSQNNPSLDIRSPVETHQTPNIERNRYNNTEDPNTNLKEPDVNGDELKEDEKPIDSKKSADEQANSPDDDKNVNGHESNTSFCPSADKVLKILFSFLLLIIVLSSGVISRISLHILLWHLHPPMELAPQISRLGGLLVRSNVTTNNGLRNSTCASNNGTVDERWIWALFIAVITPYCLSFLSSLFRVMFKTNKPLSLRVTVPVMAVEVAHSVGITIMSFIVLPSLDPVSASVAYLGIIIVPSWLSCLNVFNTNKTTIISKLPTVLGIVLNTVGCILIAVYLKDNTTLITLYIIGSVLVSIRYWENFITMGDENSKGLVWLKYELHVARTKNSLVTSGAKVLVTGVLVILIYTFRSIDLKGLKALFGDGVAEMNIDIGKILVGTANPCMGNVPFVVSAVNLSCSYICYKTSKTICIIKCQRIFSCSMIVIPIITTIFLTAILLEPSYFYFEPYDLFFNEFYIHDISKLVDRCLLLIIAVGLLISSAILITLYVWKTNGYRDGETRRIFVAPFYCGIFTELSLLLNRRRNDKEYRVIRAKVYKQEQKEQNYYLSNQFQRPMIYACATLWHESETEMKRLLESIFRLDRQRFENESRHILNNNKINDKTTRKRKYNKVRDSSNFTKEKADSTDEDVFDLEAHLFFDDAVKQGESNLEINSHVEMLIKMMTHVGSYFNNDRVKLKEGKMMQTPYGGRIKWTLPGETKIVAHLKDIKKVKRYKRWSQIMYMHYILEWKMKERILQCREHYNEARQEELLIIQHFEIKTLLEKKRRALNSDRANAEEGRNTDIELYYDKQRILLEEKHAIEVIKLIVDEKRQKSDTTAERFRSRLVIDENYMIRTIKLNFTEKILNIGVQDPEEQKGDIKRRGFIASKRLEIAKHKQKQLLNADIKDEDMNKEITKLHKEFEEIKQQIGSDSETEQTFKRFQEFIDKEEKLKEGEICDPTLKDIEEEKIGSLNEMEKWYNKKRLKINEDSEDTQEVSLEKIVNENMPEVGKKLNQFKQEIKTIPLADNTVSQDDMQEVSENTFILTLDGDIEFEAEAVMCLLRRMKKSSIVGSACGRIHPKGRGPMIWYQMFEYAISHWLQKATEHVIGCVLCGPGCFSLFRGSAILNPKVLGTYSKVATEAHQVLQYDQGEDRWLCTLLLKQGWRIEYCAEADANTCAPEGFYEFYGQRRRWAPSTLANCYEIVTDWKNITKNNENISLLFIAYQVFLIISTLLTPGMTFMLIVEALIIGFDTIPPWLILTLNIVPVGIFALMTIWSKKERQLQFAAILSSIYVLVMLIAVIGIIRDAVQDGICSVTTVVVIFETGVIFTAGLTHPKELLCLISGILYFMAIPAMSMIMFFYSVANLNERSWGTRENVEAVQNDSDENDKGFFFSFGNFFSCICCPDKVITRRSFEKEQKRRRPDIEEGTEDTIIEHYTFDQTHVKKPFDSFREDENGHEGEQLESISEKEQEFWEKLIREHIQAEFDSKNEQTQKQKNRELERQSLDEKLLSLRNSASLFVLLLNAGLVTILFALTQVNSFKEILTVEINSSNEQCSWKVDPIAFMFIINFGILLLIQFISMLYHRASTLIRILGNTAIFESEYIKQKHTYEKTIKDILSTEDFVTDENIVRTDKEQKTLSRNRKLQKTERRQVENLTKLFEENSRNIERLKNNKTVRLVVDRVLDLKGRQNNNKHWNIVHRKYLSR